jgi:quinol-cytochrome oxidoreductase complex cytochrome b subunit
MGNERTWRITTNVMLAVAAALIGVLAVSGVLLTFRYRPGSSALRAIHSGAAYLLMLSGIVLAIASITLFGIRRQWVRSVFPVIAGVLALAAVLTGLVLPWDQLAMNAVTVGGAIKGYGDVLRGGSVKYVIVGNSEVEVGAFRTWFWAHAVLLPVALGYVLFLIGKAGRRESEKPARREVGAGAQAPELLPHD